MAHTETHRIKHSLVVGAPAGLVWRHVTEVDIAEFRHPLYLSLLGIPKPLTAEVVTAGVGGSRVAYFSNGLRFTQEITEWLPDRRYAFTFHADPGFRVAYLLDLSVGPFRMVSGAYDLVEVDNAVELSLTSEYELWGTMGRIIRLPVRFVLHLFQTYLLRGISVNAEREGRRMTSHA